MKCRLPRCRLLLGLLLWPLAANAQTPRAAHAQAPLAVSAPAPLALTIGKAQLIELPQAAGTLYVADPGVASMVAPTAKRILVAGKRAGSTTLFALNAQGQVIYSADLIVGYDTQSMMGALKRDFPALKLDLTAVPNGVAVSGHVPNTQTATQVVTLLDAFVKTETGKGEVRTPTESQKGESAKDEGVTGGSGTLGSRNGRVINRMTIAESNQVTIRIRIAEVSRSVKEQLGLKWNRAATINGNGFALAASPVSMGLTGLLASEGIGGLAKGTDITAVIDALAEEKLVSILAEPNLTVMSGEKASFLAGGQMPFPVLQDDDVGIEFKDYGVVLGITPTVLSNQRISLHVRPEVSEPDYANGIQLKGYSMPGFRVRRADTTVELASGQSFALAGLISNDLTHQADKLPGLGDMPILGALARSKKFQKGESELVIIATAYLAQPSNTPLSVPNEVINQGNPFERHLLDAQPTIGATAPGAHHAAP
ncbi:type II and III secretion system protein family protein [Jeongeupia wiesaeckerbachi]|uniref:type II and III secretion system protein family protein n=1 Tax=Jeongeupia wiesaeckerbachi TaxID=3051218 RepID=UPI003D809BF8